MVANLQEVQQLIGVDLKTENLACPIKPPSDYFDSLVYFVNHAAVHC